MNAPLSGTIRDTSAQDVPVEPRRRRWLPMAVIVLVSAGLIIWAISAALGAASHKQQRLERRHSQPTASAAPQANMVM